jgi:hypothetical protein
MGITYELIEGPYPYLIALYRCRCGATVTCYGDDAGTPPDDWRTDAAATDGCMCPGCAARAAAAAKA